ncbi:uncharacterized protein LOC132624765 [Lycium barbarum]|uniref:uncharacterized protein LOC132624765 n=1 Tax=Lycium barbarum TaxID=112863 RepID=UPI00293F062C|nr:uncharacterized protein LOC132624765 [Lycium barbarum]
MIEKNRFVEADKVYLSQDNARFSSRLGELEATVSQLRRDLDSVKTDAVNMAERHRLLESESAKFCRFDSDKEIMAIETGTPSANIAPAVTPTTRTAVPPAEKPVKFTGANFKGWQQRMFFWLTTLGMQKFTSEDPLVPAADMPDNQKFMVTEPWKQAEFLCKGYILSALEDDLYNVYSAVETSKELWSALEKKYKIEDACLKKFVVAKFLDYKMVDGKTVGTQVQELQLIFHDLIAEGMVVNEAFQEATMIEKLPPSWKDFKNYLKHKRKEMKLEDLVIRLKIEEDNKTAEKRYRKSSPIEWANVVEDVAPKKNKKRKRPSGKKKDPNKKNSRVTIIIKDKEKNKGQANMVVDVDDLCAMLSECNLVGNPKEWWLDSGATRHVCAVKEAFATYTPAGPKEDLYMGNTATAKVEGYGKILLKMTFGNVLTLNNVLHIPTIRKNLVSAGLLVKNGLNKDEAIDAFKQYKNEVKNQLNKKIKMIRSDRGGEYESPFVEICLEYVKWNCGKEKSNIKGDDECFINKFRFTAELMGGSYPYS